MDRSRYTHRWVDGEKCYGARYTWHEETGANTTCKEELNGPASKWENRATGWKVGSFDCPGTNSEPPAVVAVEHCNVSDPQTIRQPNVVISQTYWRGADSRMAFFTGGKPIPRREALFILQGSAAKLLLRRAVPPYMPPRIQSEHKLPIPSTNIMWGNFGRVASDSFLYQVLPDGETNDATLRVKEADFYEFTPAVSAKYKPQIIWAGDDASGKTNSVVTGIAMQPLFSLAPPDPGMVDRLTNFSWTIAGKRIADFYVSPDALHTNGWPVPLTNTTNRIIKFYWYDQGKALKVHCEAAIFHDGKTNKLTATAFFDVFKPDGDWNGAAEGLVELGPFNGLSEVLHYGDNSSSATTNRGMIFNFASADLLSHSNEWSFEGFQIGEQYVRENFYTPNSGRMIQAVGLDASFPTWRTVFSPAIHGDNPGAEAAPQVWKLSVEHHSTSYLMFRPATYAASDTVPVPVRLVEWRWYGEAATNAIGSLVLTSSPTNGCVLRNNEPISEYPSWTNNMWNRHYISTNWF